MIGYRSGSTSDHRLVFANRRILLILAICALIHICTHRVSAETVAWPYQQQVGPFRIHADYELSGHQTMLSQLLHLRDDVAAVLRLPDSREVIDIYLFHDKQVYERYMRRYFPSVQPRRAMFIKANSPGNVFAYRSSELAVDLRHECTHAILHSVLPAVPLWLDEGLAEYFEVASEERAEQHEYFRAVRWGTRWKRPRDLMELENLERLEQMGAAEYRDAWAWVHYMIHGGPEGLAALRTYLSELATTTRPAPLSQRLRGEVAELDQAFTTHFREWSKIR